MAPRAALFEASYQAGVKKLRSSAAAPVVERQTPLVVWGTGNDIRDLVYIDDFIEGVLLAVDRPVNFSRSNSRQVPARQRGT